MRKGPYPLSVHVGMATSSWPLYSDATEQALAIEMAGGLSKMLHGISLYQNHPYTATQPELPIVWQEGTVTLRLCAGSGTGRPVVLVPSLINRSGILDLSAERSLARWLAGQGHNVYLMDWGDVATDPTQNSMDLLVLGRLVPALQYAAQKEGRKIAALGYCMGGTILVAAAMHTKVVERYIMLAAPWDFHAEPHTLLDRMTFWAPTAQPYIAAGQPLPVEGIQTLFASLDPGQAARKFSGFVDMDQNSQKAHLFIATEDWLNDGVSLPPEIARICIEEWFFENRTKKGMWVVGGEAVRPGQIAAPFLVISSEKDRLVEYESAAALCKIVQQSELLNPGCGHIGMIAGKDSVSGVWEPIHSFLQKDFKTTP